MTQSLAVFWLPVYRIWQFHKIFWFRVFRGFRCSILSMFELIICFWTLNELYSRNISVSAVCAITVVQSSTLSQCMDTVLATQWAAKGQVPVGEDMNGSTVFLMKGKLPFQSSLATTLHPSIHTSCNTEWQQSELFTSNLNCIRFRLARIILKPAWILMIHRRRRLNSRRFRYPRHRH